MAKQKKDIHKVEMTDGKCSISNRKIIRCM